MKKILVVARETYGSTDYLISGLKERRIDYKRLRTNEFPTSLSGTIYLGRESRKLIRNREGIINLEDIGIVFYQDHDISTATPSLNGDATIKEYIKNESNEFIASLFRLSKTYWLNNPIASELAENKPVQLATALDLELKIPDSLITNEPEEAKAFYKRHEGRIVTKPLKTNLIESEAGRRVMLTRKVESSDFDGLNLSPCFFQENIDKSLELRVFVIGNNVLSVAIDSQNEENTKIDWRRDPSNVILSHYKLDRSLSEKCVSLARRMGLEYGAIDLIVDTNKKPYFLEINPSGEWAWFEIKSGVPVRKALIDQLLKYL